MTLPTSFKVMRSLIALTIGLFLLAAGIPPIAEGKGAPRQTVETFLKNWLERKDFAQVRRAFAEEAFTSKVILSVDCAGYITDDDRSSHRVVENKVMKLLQDLSRDVDGRRLNDILKFGPYADKNVAGVLASPQKDGYLLIERANFEIESDESGRYVREKFPSDSYLNLLVTLNVRDKEGKTEFPMYFVWAKRGETWKIIHLDMVCI